MTVIRADLAHVPQAAPLFAAYREFYGAEPDLAAATNFLAQRLGRDESVVLLAVQGDETVGFCQIYPAFSSSQLAPIWILNDLFVAEHARGTGAADELLDAAAELGRAAGVAAIELSTAHTNQRAQAVYLRHGYHLDEVYRSYELPLS